MTPDKSPQVLSDILIRYLFLSNGFTVKEGETDLKPYVFAAGRAIEAATLAELESRRAAQAQAMPVALPTWEEAHIKLAALRTPLDRFILDNEPAFGEAEAEFRQGLLEVVRFAAAPQPPAQAGDALDAARYRWWRLVLSGPNTKALDAAIAAADFADDQDAPSPEEIDRMMDAGIAALKEKAA